MRKIQQHGVLVLLIGIWNELVIKGTNSAMAQSWKHYGKKVNENDAQIGDIVVFKQGNTAFGHVGFFKSQTDDTVTILGGNQDNKVSTKTFKKNGTLLQVIEYRRP